MAKRKKKSPIVRLVEELDSIIKGCMFVRDRREWGNKCGLCGKVAPLQWNHLVSASKYSTRWNMLNIHAFCRGCNMRHEHHPQYYTVWWIKRYGAEAYAELVEKSNQPANFKSKDLKRMIEQAKTRKEVEDSLDLPENDI